MRNDWKDALRTLLVVGRPDELRALTKRQSDVGGWIKALRKDPGLSAVLKEFPYQSTERDWSQNFNIKVKFPGTVKFIECRHLATYHQKKQAERKKDLKFDYGKFKSREAVARNVTPDIEKTYNELKAEASETHLIGNDKFGQFLASQFKAMERDCKPSRLMLVESTNHTMNLGLRIKEDERGKKSYVVKFFDPNATTTGTRSKMSGSQAFEMQTIEDYLTSKDMLNLYYPEARGQSMIYVRPEEEVHASSTKSSASGASRELAIHLDPQDIDATTVWHLMADGFAINLRQLHNHSTHCPIVNALCCFLEKARARQHFT